MPKGMKQQVRSHTKYLLNKSFIHLWKNGNNAWKYVTGSVANDIHKATDLIQQTALPLYLALQRAVSRIFPDLQQLQELNTVAQQHPEDCNLRRAKQRQITDGTPDPDKEEWQTRSSVEGKALQLRIEQVAMGDLHVQLQLFVVSLQDKTSTLRKNKFWAGPTIQTQGEKRQLIDRVKTQLQAISLRINASSHGRRHGLTLCKSFLRARCTWRR